LTPMNLVVSANILCPTAQNPQKKSCSVWNLNFFLLQRKAARIYEGRLVVHFRIILFLLLLLLLLPYGEEEIM
jgi:hypothetical protein